MKDQSQYVLASQQSGHSSQQSGIVEPFKVTSPIKTQRFCFVCKSPTGRTKVPPTAAMNMWLEHNIYIPPTNRCCASHLETDGLFNSEANEVIRKQLRELSLSSAEIGELVKALTIEAKKKEQTNTKLSFEEDSSLTSDEYKLLTGLERQHFDHLFGFCKDGVRNSSNRSARDALAIFLMKLRLDVSQECLAFLFKIEHKSKISEIIKSVSTTLKISFLPLYLGYGHITRADLIALHTPPFVKTILGADQASAVIIMDGTYLYIEKSSNHLIQKKTYSSHKLRNLLKPMMVVAADGYILHVEGLYNADGDNNDAMILKDMLERTEFKDYFLVEDELILDRGFRDAVTEANKQGFNVSIPDFLGKKENQLSAKAANDMRKVTKIRWPVEGAHGRVKQVYNLLASTVDRKTYV